MHPPLLPRPRYSKRFTSFHLASYDQCCCGAGKLINQLRNQSVTLISVLSILRIQCLHSITPFTGKLWNTSELNEHELNSVKRRVSRLFRNQTVYLPFGTLLLCNFMQPRWSGSFCIFYFILSILFPCFSKNKEVNFLDNLESSSLYVYEVLVLFCEERYRL